MRSPLRAGRPPQGRRNRSERIWPRWPAWTRVPPCVPSTRASQSAAGAFRGQPLRPEPRGTGRLRSGGSAGADASRGEVRPYAGLPVLDLRLLVDSHGRPSGKTPPRQPRSHLAENDGETAQGSPRQAVCLADDLPPGRRCGRPPVRRACRKAPSKGCNAFGDRSFPSIARIPKTTRASWPRASRTVATKISGRLDQRPVERAHPSACFRNWTLARGK